SQPVAAFEQAQVMASVPGGDVEERAGADGLSARDPDAAPALLVEPGEERQRLPAYRLKLVDEVTQRAAVEPGHFHVGVLIEGGQRSGVAPGDAQGAVGEDALRVGEVTDYLFRAPPLPPVPTEVFAFRHAGPR